jgi:uncharacterized SAM-binding protein YcdF (DUF218 family)
MEKKYIFESKKTRIQRQLLSIAGSCMLLFLFINLFVFILVLVANQENQVSQLHFFKKTPDLIIVFTGDIGRIPFALDKNQELGKAKILVSGVNRKNSVQQILKKLGRDEQTSLDNDVVDLDFESKDTFDNVKNSLEYVKNNSLYKNNLIISHDYHIMRIKILLWLMRDGIPKDTYFHFMSVRSDFFTWRHFKLLYTELFKVMLTPLQKYLR